MSLVLMHIYLRFLVIRRGDALLYRTVPYRTGTVREGPAASTNLMVRCEKPHVNQVTLVPYCTVLYCMYCTGWYR